MDTKVHDVVVRRLMDEGKLMAAGWYLYRTRIMPRDAGLTQIEETRKAFYAGAQHVFASICGGFDQSAEPTEADVVRMERLHDELQSFVAEMTPTKGRG